MAIIRREIIFKTAIIITCIIVVVAISTPRSDDALGERISTDDIRAMTDGEINERVTLRISQRRGSAVDGWRRLPPAAKSIYVIRVFENDMGKYPLVVQAATSRAFPAAPSLNEAADAYRAIGATVCADIMDKAASTEAQATDAMDAWAEHLRDVSATPRPKDPLELIGRGLREALKKEPSGPLISAYIRVHAGELADP